ncbi:MAG: TonB family protein [Chromatiales bacterium]|nr:TonB family protein [Chromatiales bacterium]
MTLIFTLFICTVATVAHGRDDDPRPCIDAGPPEVSAAPKKAEPILLTTPEAMMRRPGDYPAEAQANGIGGYVLLQFTLPDDGRPSRPVVVMSEPKGVFEEAALAKLQFLAFEVPSQWLIEHPNRRHELVFMYYVWGSTPPEVPDFDLRAIAVIGRK